jgi:hypothetical protein
LRRARASLKGYTLTIHGVAPRKGQIRTELIAQLTRRKIITSHDRAGGKLTLHLQPYYGPGNTLARLADVLAELSEHPVVTDPWKHRGDELVDHELALELIADAIRDLMLPSAS